MTTEEGPTSSAARCARAATASSFSSGSRSCKRLPCDGAIHGARIEMSVVEPPGDLAGNGAFAGPGRTVNGDNQTTGGHVPEYIRAVLGGRVRSAEPVARNRYDSASGGRSCVVDDARRRVGRRGHARGCTRSRSRSIRIDASRRFRSSRPRTRRSLRRKAASSSSARRASRGGRTSPSHSRTLRS